MFLLLQLCLSDIWLGQSAIIPNSITRTVHQYTATSTIHCRRGAFEKQMFLVDPSHLFLIAGIPIAIAPIPGMLYRVYYTSWYIHYNIKSLEV